MVSNSFFRFFCFRSLDLTTFEDIFEIFLTKAKGEFFFLFLTGTGIDFGIDCGSKVFQAGSMISVSSDEEEEKVTSFGFSPSEDLSSSKSTFTFLTLVLRLLCL